eukprot:CAMPEP_0194364520 /NCGR_PEP_ID=MMETSP0174-20130528/12426_1 /TAXON_ID=216777 /ORGANISM="Proboscia alata, Strain PI-D3" /LENGTH=573 /DNA_ID=CAMNT_0039138587 /DNA_START=34 /DNA_END=1755 /DNA_ORIENTATION=+
MSRETCPYLDTIHRKQLDFDFEHCCSITLQSTPHIYGCLVCGKFFLGRGSKTPAFVHSVEESHCVFVHLSTGRFYCLPDNYEVVNNPSLRDIRNALNPRFTVEQVNVLEESSSLSRDLFGRRYLPGFVGMNNLKKTDGINAVVQALAHVRPLRDFFLRLSTETNNSTQYSHLALSFGEVLRKVWSHERFKSTVDPHEFLQAVSVASQKRFRIGRQTEASEFLAWLLHNLHLGVGGKNKNSNTNRRKRGKSSVIHEIFQGRVEITNRQRRSHVESVEVEEDDREGSDHEEAGDDPKRTREELDSDMLDETTISSQFLQLTLDIPEKPLFKDDDGGLVIPQEPLVSVLRKFDGLTFSDALHLQKNATNNGVLKRRYRLTHLPPYLILHLARFKRNVFDALEKNPTIVAFPVKNLDLSSYVFDESVELKQSSKQKKKRRTNSKIPKSTEDVMSMSMKEMKEFLISHNRKNVANGTEKDPSTILQSCLDIVQSLHQSNLTDVLSHKYDLVANICHDSPAEVGREGKRNPLEEGSYRCHVQHTASRQWYEMQDLHVRETMPQLIGISESYLLIFERKG